MTDAKHLFFGADADKQSLHRRIVPNREQIELQQERWNDLRDFLTADLNERSGYRISSWLQGSYKFGTQVRPVKKGGEYDIDLGIYFNWSGSPNDGSLSPHQLKHLVQDSLTQYMKEAEEAVLEVTCPPKERCSRIRFSEQFHIDVPSYHLDQQRDARALATERNGWEDSDPKALHKWFQQNFSGEDSAQVRRLIRYMKVWSQLRQFEETPSSVLLTVLVAEAYQGLREHELQGDDLVLRHVSDIVATRLANDSRVPNPVNLTENLNRQAEDQIQTFIRELNGLTELADKAIAAPSELTTATLWATAFQHFFPVSPENTESSSARGLVPLEFVPDVHVSAVPNTNKKARFAGRNGIGPIPKDCQIEFTLLNAASLPRGALVQWVVRNEGDEAEFRNDLGHLAGTNPKMSEERSLYKGTHSMDITVLSSTGIVLGFRRILVEISGAFMPPRNPRKPGYTRIRRRK